jgi:hypothetical protein
LGVAVDTAGDVYIANYATVGSGGTVSVITPSDTVTTITGFYSPAGVAVD